MNTTQFWQIASLVMSLVQLLLFIDAFNHYRAKLEELADDLRKKANERFCALKALRDRDVEFFTYFNNLPDYFQSNSNVMRSRGAALSIYADKLRSTIPTVRGFLPAQKAALANLFGCELMNRVSMKRVQTEIAERSRVDDHTLQRWEALISATTSPSGVFDYGSIVDSSFKSLEAFGKAANASLYQFGTGLYRINNNGQ